MDTGLTNFVTVVNTYMNKLLALKVIGLSAFVPVAGQYMMMAV